MSFPFRSRDSERQILNSLADRARAGIKEAGYLVDEDTGDILDYCEAHDETPYEIDFPEALALSRSRVCYLHCHCVPSLPGEDDWNNVIELPRVVRYITVCSDYIYTIKRTAQTYNPYRSSPALVFDFEVIKRLKQSSLHDMPIKQAMKNLPEQELRDILRDVNFTMAQIFQVTFEEEPLS